MAVCFEQEWTRNACHGSQQMTVVQKATTTYGSIHALLCGEWILAARKCVPETIAVPLPGVFMHVESYGVTLKPRQLS